MPDDGNRDEVRAIAELAISDLIEPGITDEDRVYFVELIREAFCVHCGRRLATTVCACTNED